jgi:SAM-dependent methyltransferase
MNLGSRIGYYNKLMQAEIIAKLLAINEEFYQRFGAAFAATRRRIQPGVVKMLTSFLRDGDWLDLGCGSGAILTHLIKSGFKGSYTGVDFSEALLNEARENLLVQPPHAELEVNYVRADLLDPLWPALVKRDRLTGVLAFASLHHLPGNENRVALLRAVRRFLDPGGQFIHSEWQFQHSPKLMSRVLPWSTGGIAESDVEEGDTLLDWRHTPGGQEGERGLRYVHLFSREELKGLADECGYRVLHEFESDGKGGNLALYQVWTKTL